MNPESELGSDDTSIGPKDEPSIGSQRAQVMQTNLNPSKRCSERHLMTTSTGGREGAKTIRSAILRKKPLSSFIGISCSSIDRARKSGDFPAPVKLGAQAIGWRIEDVEAWLASRETKVTH